MTERPPPKVTSSRPRERGPAAPSHLHFCPFVDTHRESIINRKNNNRKNNNLSLKSPKARGIGISMDSRGRALNNVFIERLWRTVKYEEIYRREYDSMNHLRRCLRDYFEFYNHHRPHSALGEPSAAAFHAAHLPAEDYAS